MKKSDICDGIIRYARRKTGQHLEVLVEPMMQEIMDRYPSTTRYQFPILIESDDEEKVYTRYLRSIHLYNKSLRQLGQMLGGVKLTSYVSRHSWASTAHVGGIALSVISQALGHDSEKTTEIYLKSLEANRIDDANRSVINGVFGKSGK